MTSKGGVGDRASGAQDVTVGDVDAMFWYGAYEGHLQTKLHGNLTVADKCHQHVSI